MLSARWSISKRCPSSHLLTLPSPPPTYNRLRPVCLSCSHTVTTTTMSTTIMQLLTRLRSSSPSPTYPSARTDAKSPSPGPAPAPNLVKVHVLTAEESLSYAYYPASDPDLPAVAVPYAVSRFVPAHNPEPSSSRTSTLTSSHARAPSLPVPYAYSPPPAYTSPVSSMSMPSSASQPPRPTTYHRALATLRSRSLHLSRSAHTTRSSHTGLRALLDMLGLHRAGPAQDSEQAFQDAQHAAHVCWRCRRAGGRRKNCRAFRRPGRWLSTEVMEMYS
ncbi:hypothetical protein AcV7_000012 [Taiwanofungus camphoratus]|nr:hypothetical protein AcV7_000012 [Antrodia cinnamomea]